MMDFAEMGRTYKAELATLQAELATLQAELA